MNVWVVVTYRGPNGDGEGGKRATYSMPAYSAALLVLYPPDDVYSLLLIGGNVDDYLRSHVPFTPLAERPHIQAGRELAECN